MIFFHKYMCYCEAWHVFCSHIVPSYSQYKPKPMYEGNLFSNSLSAILRSDKIEKLKRNPKAAMLFYDKEEKIQVRLKVECLVNHNNEITKESWSKTQHISRKCYLVDNGPGSESKTPTSGLKPELDNFEFTMEHSEEGYKNFTVIQCKIKSVEWLYLAAKGHRRAKFDLETSKNDWLVP